MSRSLVNFSGLLNAVTEVGTGCLRKTKVTKLVVLSLQGLCLTEHGKYGSLSINNYLL